MGEKVIKIYGDYEGKELKAAQDALESNGIKCRIRETQLMVHVSDFIRARDILLEMKSDKS